jgi:hypothetical protein
VVLKFKLIIFQLTKKCINKKENKEETMLKSNFAKISIIFAAIAVLVVGVAIPVSADTTSTTATTSSVTTLHTVQGVVNAVNSTSGSFTVGSTSVAVSTDANTKYYLIPLGKADAYVNNKVARDPSALSRAAKLKDLHIPANWRDNLGFLDTFGQKGAFSDISVGDRVIARVNSSGVAAQILIIKAPVIRQVRGTVTISGNNITVNALNGTTVNLTWAATTEFIIKGYALPSGVYGVVTYNSSTNVASLVNFAAQPPPTPVTTSATTP